MSNKGHCIEFIVREVLDVESNAFVVVDLWEGEIRVGDIIRGIRKSNGTFGSDELQIRIDKIIAYDREVSILTSGFAGGLVLSGGAGLEICKGDTLLV